MKKGWKVKKLGEVCQIATGKLNANAANIDGKYPFFTCSRETFTIDKFAFDCEAILLAGNNAVGDFNVKYYKGKFNAYQRTYVITINEKEKLLYKYLYLLIDNKLQEFKNKSVGAATKFLKIGMIQDLEIPYPPISEQQEIVRILDEAFDGINTIKANTEKNLQNARELFESYLQNIFANPGIDWDIKKLGEVCNLKSGTTVPMKFEKTEGDFPYLKVADMNLQENKDYIVTSSRFLNQSDIKTNSLVPVGSTIFPKRGGAILTNKKRLTQMPVCIDLNLMAVTPKSEILSEFIYYYFIGLDLRKINNGSAIPQINNYSIEPLIINFPKSLSEQKAIVKKLDQLSTETKRLEKIYQQKLTDLEELKKSILQKAFNGELT